MVQRHSLSSGSLHWKRKHGAAAVTRLLTCWTNSARARLMYITIGRRFDYIALVNPNNGVSACRRPQWDRRKVMHETQINSHSQNHASFLQNLRESNINHLRQHAVEGKICFWIWLKRLCCLYVVRPFSLCCASQGHSQGLKLMTDPSRCSIWILEQQSLCCGEGTPTINNFFP